MSLYQDVILAFATALVLTEVVSRCAGPLGLVSHPCERSSHSAFTPHGGGVAVVAGVVAGLAHLTVAEGSLAWVGGRG